jgi:hypothetical protein
MLSMIVGLKRLILSSPSVLAYRAATAKHAYAAWPGEAKHGGKRAGMDSNMVKFQQRYVNSHGDFHNLRSIKEFCPFCSSQILGRFSPLISGV